VPWARLDDKAITNRKLRKLSSDGFRVWVLGLVHCAQELTDGFIASDVLEMFPLRDKALAAAVAELTTAQVAGKAALWSETGGGYQVHDYLQWNQSRAEVEAERKRKRANKESWKNRRGTGSEPAGNHGPSHNHNHDHVEQAPTELAPSAPKLRKADKEPDSPVQRLLRRYAELLATNIGQEKPEFNWPKAGTIFKRLLDGRDEALVRAALERFMADRSEFCVEAAWTLGVFSARFNSYISNAVPAPKRKANSAATGVTDDWSEF